MYQILRIISNKRIKYYLLRIKYYVLLIINISNITYYASEITRIFV